MVQGKSIKKALGLAFAQQDDAAEAVCRMETPPPLMLSSSFGGPALVSLGKSYCVKR